MRYQVPPLPALRAAIVWDHAAIPWAPLMLGLAEGLRAHGVDVLERDAGPAWLAPELLASSAPDVVLVGLHDKLRPHVAGLRAAVPSAVPFVALAFDDPHDHATALALLPFFDVVLTPEPCAVATYLERAELLARDRGRPLGVDVLAPTVSSRWHQPHAGTDPVRHDWDVLHIGGNHWAPRKTFLPALVHTLQARGYRYGEAAGVRRWLAGDQVAAALHRCRLTLDIPRDGVFPSTNPYQVPATYTTPRVHLAAACGVVCLVVGPRGDHHQVYPAMPSAPLEHGIAAVLELLERPAAELDAIAAANRRDFVERHAPAIRAGELLELLGRHCPQLAGVAASRQ